MRPAYNALLFNAIKSAVLSRMSTLVTQPGMDQYWKGGMTPYELKLILLNQQVHLDDLCNPYLVHYLPSVKIGVTPAPSSGTGIAATTCMDAAYLNTTNVQQSYQQRMQALFGPAVVDIYSAFMPNLEAPNGTNKSFDQIYPVSGLTSGNFVVQMNPANQFDKDVLFSLGMPTNANRNRETGAGI